MKHSLLKVIFFTIFLTGCGLNPENKATPLSETHQKFLKLCQENKLNAALKEFDNTLWIYLPIKEKLMETVATDEGAQKSDKSEERPSVKYIDTSYNNKRFLLTYDIRQDKTYGQSQGYKLGYTAFYQQASRQILTAISQAYFNTEQAPLFFAIIIADIENGLEIQNIFYLEDLKRYMMFESIPQEEFVKRNIYEIKGKTAWIGDADGRHLEYREITMPEFLAKQMAGRINFKYQQSSFPPSSDTRAEVVGIIKETLHAYKFTDFNYIELRDLATGLVETLPSAELTP